MNVTVGVCVWEVTGLLLQFCCLSCWLCRALCCGASHGMHAVCVRKGIPLEDVQGFLHHVDPRTTRLYDHSSDGEGVDLVDEISDE